ncbi:MAG: ABC transporter ATP-binding protein [Anaerolineaceae bacterium]|nr:ABC transporter ATP-binding protein [Anaerolineaceae bacterium]
MTDQTFLQVENLETYYGVIRALKGISFDVKQGEIVALIGGNGAGKTTTLYTLTGILKPKNGRVLFDGKEIQKKQPEDIVKLGFALVPEGRQVFGKLTVRENLRMGAYSLKDNVEYNRRLDEVFTLFPRLQERVHQQSGTLSGGEQQMLAMGRAMMQGPRFLALDEPSMGLAPIVVEEIFKTILRINKEGVTILLVEQKATMALRIANRAFVLETGSIALGGTHDELIKNPMIRKAYLGISD